MRTRLALLATLSLCLAPLAAPADPLRGERVFQRCYSCHSVVEGENNLQGPNLRGVIGRRAATLPGFEYSEEFLAASRARDLVWTRETLAAFIADPERFIAGTKMTQSLPGAEDRRDVIDFLEQAGR